MRNLFNKLMFTTTINNVLTTYIKQQCGTITILCVKLVFHQTVCGIDVLTSL